MTLGDLDPAALDSARAIAAETPGVAIVAGQDGQWYRARSFYVTEAAAEHAARTYADLAPSWDEITAHLTEPRSQRLTQKGGAPMRRLACWLLDTGPVLVLAVIAGAGSFTHIRDTATEHGQTGWMAWAMAVCIDLTCVMAARERQRDKKTGRGGTARISWPVLVLTGGIVLSLAANLAPGRPDRLGLDHRRHPGRRLPHRRLHARTPRHRSPT